MKLSAEDKQSDYIFFGCDILFKPLPVLCLFP